MALGYPEVYPRQWGLGEIFCQVVWIKLQFFYQLPQGASHLVLHGDNCNIYAEVGKLIYPVQPME